MARSRNLAGLRGLVRLGNESVLPGQGGRFGDPDQFQGEIPIHVNVLLDV